MLSAGRLQPGWAGRRGSVAGAMVVALRRDATLVAPFVVTLGAVTSLSWAHGGYFPSAWAWSSLGFLWVLAFGLLTRADLDLDFADRALIASLGALTAWIGASAAWSPSPGRSILELQRALVYFAAVSVVLVVAHRRSIRHLVGGLLAGTTLVSAYAVSGPLLREGAVGAEPRLAGSLGYSNALGILAAVGILLALAFVTDGKTRAARALAAASLVILSTTLLFTLSRGPWVALALGLVAALSLSARRLHAIAAVLVVAPAPALAIWLAWRSLALSPETLAIGDVPQDGPRFAVALLVLAAGAAAATYAFSYAESRFARRRGPKLAYGAAFIVSAFALVAGLVALREASPAVLVEPQSTVSELEPGHDERARLFSLGHTYRSDIWRVAIENFAAHPWLGSGSGSYEQVWLQQRPTRHDVRDAHSLYLETLTELGLIGFALLVVALGAPLLAAVRSRRHPLVPAVAGAYVAYLVHAAVDWDWEMPAVTVTGLFCGAALVLAGRRHSARNLVSPRVRAGAVAITFAVAAFAFVGLVGNSALTEGREAAWARNWREAERHARRAMPWMPWSSRPWSLLGEAQLARGDRSGARASMRAAIEKDAHNWRLWFELARATEGRGQQRALAEATRLNPRSEVIEEFLHRSALSDVASRRVSALSMAQAVTDGAPMANRLSR